MTIKNRDMAEKWKVIDIVSEGRDELVAKNKLVQFPQETPTAYKIRKQNAVFYNMFNRTITGLTGVAFYKDIVLSSNNKESILEAAEDIDMLGTHLNLFAQDVLNASLKYGHTFMFIGYPDNNATTREQSKQSKLRPFWSHILPHNVVYWRKENVNGVPRLTLLIIKDTKMTYDGYSESSEDIYRVYALNTWQILDKDENEVEKGEHNLGYIPIVPVYSNKTGFFESSPLFYDMALSNIKHFNMSSDLDSILHKTCVPLLVHRRLGTDMSSEKESVTISPNSLIEIGEDEILSYVEPTGASIKLVQEELANIEKRIAKEGMSMLLGKKQQTQTATESKLDFTLGNAGLNNAMKSLKDGIEQSFVYHAKYIGETESGSVSLATDFKIGDTDANLLNALHTALENGNYSADQWFDYLKTNNLTSEDFDQLAEIRKREEAKEKIAKDEKAKSCPSQSK